MALAVCVRNPAHCHPNSLPRLSNSISPAPPPPLLPPSCKRLPLRWPSPRRTSCSSYSEIWECSSVLKHLNYCTAEPEQHGNHSSGANTPLLLLPPPAPPHHHRRRCCCCCRESPLVFWFSCSERRLTCFLCLHVGAEAASCHCSQV